MCLSILPAVVLAAVAVIGFLLSLSEVPDNAMEGSDFLYDVFDY